MRDGSDKLNMVRFTLDALVTHPALHCFGPMIQMSSDRDFDMQIEHNDKYFPA